MSGHYELRSPLPFLSQSYFLYEDHRRKEERKNYPFCRIIHFAQLITTNVIAICTRGEPSHAGLDDSSIIPPDTNGVDVPEIVGILRLNSRHQMNLPLSRSINPPSLPFPCLVASETTRAIARETRGTFAAYRVSNLELEPPKISPSSSVNRDSAIPNFPLSSRASKRQLAR